MRVAALVLGAAAVLANGCDEQPIDEIANLHPPGTVMLAGDVPILASEVDEITPLIALIEPVSSDAQLRRLALTNVVLPRALARAIAPAEREAARAQAVATLARLRGGEVLGPAPAGSSGGELREGQWAELGLQVWYAAWSLPDGEWSEPIEDAGRFVLVKRLKRTDAPVPGATRFQVEIAAFPWLDAHSGGAQVDAAYDTVHLEIVDPAWRIYVPELTQYRMGARKP